MSKFALKSAEIMAKGVVEGVEACKAAIERLKGGSSQSVDDEIARNELDMAIQQLDMEIRNLSQFEQSDELVQKFEEFTATKWDAQKTLNELDVRLKPNENIIVQNRAPERPISSIFTRLPEIEMTKFDGNVLHWTEFWEQFCTNVHRRKDMSDDVKLTYLKSNLEGDAKETLGGLRNTAGNYTIAIDRLTERYAKPQRILDAHYEALDNLPMATSDINECRRLLNQLDIHMGILKSLGEDTNHNTFRRTLMKKFPPEIIHDLRLLMKSREGHTVEELRGFLEQTIVAREESSHLTSIADQGAKQPTTFTTESLYVSGQTPQDKHQEKGSRKRNREKPKIPPPKPKEGDANPKRDISSPSTSRMSNKRGFASTSQSTTNGNGTPAKTRRMYQCRFCKGNHFTDQCDVIASIEKRKAWVFENGLCFQCLSKDHTSKSCTNKRECVHCKLFGKHNRCLCPSLESRKDTTSTLFARAGNKTILQTSSAYACGQHGRTAQCRILFDTGSEKSYITAELQKSLKPLIQEKTELTIYTFGNRRPITRNTDQVLFTILTNGGPVEVSAYVIPVVTGTIPSFPKEKTRVQSLFPHLQIAPDTQDDRPADIVIGNDFYYAFIKGGVKKVSDRLHLLDSGFGWIISGSQQFIPTNTDKLSVLTFVQSAHSTNPGVSLPDPALQDDKIKDLWELETIGITDSPKVLQDDDAIRQFNETTQFINGRYFVRWPWAQYPPELPVNLGLAIGRLRGLLKRHDTQIIKQYDAVLQDQMNKGVIEQIQEQSLPKSRPVHYLSHHCVIQEGRTTKLRIVYDASAKVKGQHSLNEFLYKGPLMLEEQVGLLLRFRAHKIGLISDIEKAFLQLGLQEVDRDVTRFLWLRDISRGVTEDNIIHLRFCRVPFGVISSPFLLAATITLHLQKKGSPLSTQMARSLYVDNLITGAGSYTEAKALYEEARTNFTELSMNIREWKSNDSSFMTHIPESVRKEDSVVPVLGLQWDTEVDHLRLAVTKQKIEQNVETKRQALSVIASVYDPCGLSAPLTVSTRIFLQSLWIAKVKWDEKLTPSQQDEWVACVESLKAIPDISFPRFYGIPPGQDVEMHCFTDASNQCYSAVVYLRAMVGGEAVVSLVISKSRLTPVRNKDKITIPKLELLAVLIGTRLVNYVKKVLGLSWSGFTLWTDSQIVLGWIKSSRLLNPFVSRRIEEINRSSHIQFRYVPSSMNPADVATRPLSSCSLPTIWTNGPDFLKTSPQRWPRQQEHSEQCVELEEATQTADPTTPTVVAATVVQPSVPQILELPEQGIVLSVPTILSLQKAHFPQETKRIHTPLFKSLGLFVDSDGVLRCKGRYRNAVMSYSQKYPILLPHDSSVTTAIVQRVHQEHKHVGVTHTLALIRERFWIPKGRRTVTNVIRKCQACVKYGGGPYALPQMPDLPRERVSYSPPFTYTGLDYLGPLTVADNGAPRKRWICLFTCLAVRAIHLELVNDLTTEEFTLALRRFVALRGAPSLLISDNAAQFKVSATVLKSVPASPKSIEWKFIPALSPWQGGFYERLIGLVKHCLQRTLDTALLTSSQLQTTMKEIESVLNTRPLTAVGSDVEHILTPKDFFLWTASP